MRCMYEERMREYRRGRRRKPRSVRVSRGREGVAGVHPEDAEREIIAHSSTQSAAIFCEAHRKGQYQLLDRARCGRISDSRGFLSSDVRSSSRGGHYDDPLCRPCLSLQRARRHHRLLRRRGPVHDGGSAEPTLCVVFSPARPEEVRHALRVVGAIHRAQLRALPTGRRIQEWEKRHADPSLDRGEPSLRAA